LPIQIGQSSTRNRRLAKIKTALKGNAITVVIDETDEKGKTDYVAKQYLEHRKK